MPALGNLDQLCRHCAEVFVSRGIRAPSAEDVLELLAEEERQRVAKINADMLQADGRRNERVFLRDERGKAFGQVVAEIPMELYMHAASPKNKRWGPDAMKSQEGKKEFLKAYPECRVTNVDRRVHAHSSRGRKNFSGINWGRGTINFAT